MAAYTCGGWLEGRRAAAVVLGAAALEGVDLVVVGSVRPVTTVLGSPGPGPSGVLLAGQVAAGLVGYVAAAAVGAHVTTRRRYVDLVRLRGAEAVAAQQARADAATGLERARMARELHDVAAHHLSGMVVQAAVVERLIDRDPAAAKEAAASMRRQGRATLDDLRLVVGTLRENTDPEGSTPVPGLAALDALVDAARAAGTAVEVERVGDARELPPLADATMHRVAQEALANVRDHAPGAAVRVRLVFAPTEVVLDVENDAVTSRGIASRRRQPEVGRGFGLVGMAERAKILGADLDAGPTSCGGWRIVLSVPHDGDGAMT